MILGELVKGMSHYELSGDPEQPINGLAYDSRQVQPGNLFVAIRGHEQDGHDYLRDALKKGAVALVGESFPGIGENVTRVRVKDSREALSKLSILFYDHPFEGLNLIGITGTNGKNDHQLSLGIHSFNSRSETGCRGNNQLSLWG